jgi:hypothetical protein
VAVEGFWQGLLVDERGLRRLVSEEVESWKDVGSLYGTGQVT